MSDWKARAPDYAERVRESFDRQGVMGLLGARLGRVVPGRVEIEIPYRSDLSQQHGFFHAGISTTVADSAAGGAALTLMPAGSEVLAVEFKLNWLAPADGELLVATGQVIRPGRTLTVSEMRVHVVRNGGEPTLVAAGLQTSIRIDASTGRVAPAD